MKPTTWCQCSRFKLSRLFANLQEAIEFLKMSGNIKKAAALERQLGLDTAKELHGSTADSSSDAAPKPLTASPSTNDSNADQRRLSPEMLQQLQVSPKVLSDPLARYISCLGWVQKSACCIVWCPVKATTNAPALAARLQQTPQSVQSLAVLATSFINRLLHYQHVSHSCKHEVHRQAFCLQNCFAN